MGVAAGLRVGVGRWWVGGGGGGAGCGRKVRERSRPYVREHVVPMGGLAGLEGQVSGQLSIARGKAQRHSDVAVLYRLVILVEGSNEHLPAQRGGGGRAA